MRSSVVIAVVILAAGLGPAAQAAPPAPAGASAATVVLVDGGGDVWTYSDTTTGYTPAVRPDADVLGASIVPRVDSLRIRMSFDDLRRGATQWYRATVRGPDTTHWYVVEGARGHWAGRVYEEVQGEWVAAPGVTAKIDYARDRFVLTVPYAALDDATSVRVRLRNDLGAPDGDTFFTDNPGNHTAHGRFGAPIALP